MNAAVVIPDSATIFAAICACIFVVVGVAGKFFFFHFNSTIESESKTIFALLRGKKEAQYVCVNN